MDHFELSTLDVCIGLALTTASYGAYRILTTPASKSSVKELRGPKSPSMLMGHFAQMVDPTPELLDSWFDKYGLTMRTFVPLGGKAIYTADPKVASFVFNNSMTFKKPDMLKAAIEMMTGPGVFAMEGDVNRKQRRVLNPAFSAPQVKQLSPIISHKVQELRDAWIAEMGDSGTATIDVLSWLGHMAIDMIGIAGFGYQFNTLRDHLSGEMSNELANAFENLLTTATAIDVVGVLTNVLPITQQLPFRRNIVIRECLATLRRIGLEIVQDKRKKLSHVEEPEKEKHLDKDLLSALMRSNMQESGAGKMDDEEVLAQIATFIIAGQDTSSAAMTWALYALSKSPVAQEKLRAEIHAFPNDSPTFDELNSLQYLDYVVKETLRLHIPVPLVQRVPLMDMVVPLSYPVSNNEGKEIREIHLHAGDDVILSTGGLNYSKQFWGPDAHEFIPERFANLPEKTGDIPSGFGNVTTFISGPRMCIGWRLAVAEMKATLFTLLRNFVFEIDPSLVIGKKSTIVARPFIVGDSDPRCRLPLKISLCKQTSVQVE